MTCKDVMFGVWFVRGDTQPRGVHAPPEKTYQARRSPMCAPCIRGRRAVFFFSKACDGDIELDYLYVERTNSGTFASVSQV